MVVGTVASEVPDSATVITVLQAHWRFLPHWGGGLLQPLASSGTPTAFPDDV